MSTANLIHEIRALRSNPHHSDECHAGDAAKHILDTLISKGEFVQGCPKALAVNIMPVTKLLVDLFIRHGLAATYDETDAIVFVHVALPAK